MFRGKLAESDCAGLRYLIGHYGKSPPEIIVDLVGARTMDHAVQRISAAFENERTRIPGGDPRERLVAVDGGMTLRKGRWQQKSRDDVELLHCGKCISCKTFRRCTRKAARDIWAQGEPGFGISACEYMAARDIALTMGDTSANDAQPAGEMGTDYAVHCHTEMQTRRGIWNLENVDTKSLVDNKIYEGAFIWAPLRMIGATGSPGNPVVLY